VQVVTEPVGRLLWISPALPGRAPDLTAARTHESYLQDTWVASSAADKTAVDVHDAVTGETVCRVSSQGLDLAGAFDHARRAGGTALRALSFHRRADLLDALVAAARARREELYALSTRAGATLNDARYDVDGGIRVLRDYAARARTELPDAPHLVEGPAERLARGEDFLGVHLVSPSPGLMLQVNAFNFPVWAPLEKLAQAVLAGMPSVVKPATPTAYLTEHLVRIITDAGALPPGALQMVAGSVRPALGLIGEQGVLSFTGSAASARTLRTHPNLVARSVRFNAEADSVNAIVLAPDVTPGSPLFEAFVREVVTEMTVKAGQKCTAIRRVLVPREHEAAALDAIAAELAGVTIGDPAAEGVRMGPVVSLAQRDDVRQAARRIAKSGRFVHGDPEEVRVLDADPERGRSSTPFSSPPTRTPPHLTRCSRSARPRPCWRTVTRPTRRTWWRVAEAASRPPSSATTSPGRPPSSKRRHPGTGDCTCWTRRTWRRPPATDRRFPP
jgi:oxepin-CoA hydrolase/3-oxo-5,6-dehydrosuberyl-CoA semialdehyde dehydrogenase